MKKRTGFFLSWIAGLSLVIAGFGSCIKSDNSASATITPKTYVSVLHMAPYAPPVEIYLNDTKSSEQILADTYFSVYSQLNPGSYDIKFKKAGADSLVAEIPASHYDSLNFYTLLLYNDSHTSTKAVTIPDDFSNVTGTTSFYRFFNLNPDAGSVDVYFSNTMVQNARTPADNVTNHTYNRFQSYAPGYYSIVVKAASSDSVVASATSISMQPGNVYTIMIKGQGTQNIISVLTGSY